MSGKTKTLLGIGLVTIIILLGGVFLLSKVNPSPSSTETVDATLLIRDNSNKIIAPHAKVTLVEFGDFQCPACAPIHPVVKQILSDHKGKISFVFRNFPLTQHQNAQIAAEAAEAAGEQGKYWEMHDKLYENQTKWAESNNALDIFLSYAKDLKLDIEKFKEAVTNNKYANKISQDQQDGNTLGVNATPTFFINGKKFDGADIKTTIDSLVK